MTMKKATLRESSKDAQETNDLKVINISDEQLAKINKQTITPLSREEVFAFSILLIDDAPTRNGTLYPESFQRTILNKEARKGNWIGLTLLMGQNEDHETKASNQVARIYDARLVKTPRGNVGTIGEAYIPVNKSTRGFIDSIRAGIHREVSIGVAVEEPTCSVCGEDIRLCDHEPMGYYGSEQCIIVMKGDAEAQEVSFVAVPGSYNAEVLSDTSGYVPLREAFGKSTITKENKRMTKKKLSKEALLAQDLAKYSKMIEAKLKNSSTDDDEYKEEDVDDKDLYSDDDDVDGDAELYNMDDVDDGDDDWSTDDKTTSWSYDGDDNDFDENNDDDKEVEEEDANPRHALQEDEDDDDDDDDDDDNPFKTEEALRSTFNAMKRIEKRMQVLESQAKAGREYHRQVLKETLRLGVLSKTIPVQSKETFRKTFAKLSLTELLEFQKGYKVEVERMYPSTGKAVGAAERIATKESSQRKPQSMGISDIISEFTR